MEEDIRRANDFALEFGAALAEALREARGGAGQDQEEARRGQLEGGDPPRPQPPEGAGRPQEQAGEEASGWSRVEAQVAGQSPRRKQKGGSGAAGPACGLAARPPPS